MLGGLLALTDWPELGLLAQEGPKEDRVVRLMEEYTNAPGRRAMRGRSATWWFAISIPVGAEVSIDGMGSVIGIVRGTSDRPRIMVDAHMDELGLMVQYIRPDGFIVFKSLGYPDHWLSGQALGHPHQPRAGLCPHWRSAICTFGRRKNASTGVPREEIVLDVGAASKEEAEQLGIRPGDLIAPVSPFTVMAHQRYAAKAWDDRVGVRSCSKRCAN